MSSDIVARLPKHVGKVINCGAFKPMKLRDDHQCEHCRGARRVAVPNMATTVRRGEADPFGFELMFLCDACDKTLRNVSRLKEKKPKKGYVFAVIEGYGLDNQQLFGKSFTSRHQAELYYRKLKLKSGMFRGGLYPDRGVREMPVEDFKELMAREKMCR